MTMVRIVSYVVDPYSGERRAVAALMREELATRLVRSPDPGLPQSAEANVERILQDIEAAPDFHDLPRGAGAQAIAGQPIGVPADVADAAVWVREILLRRAS
jgi:hypothetical protein